jgi:hypothetical protein
MHAPQHRPPEAGQNARHEEGRQSAVVMTRARFRDLVQGSESETAAWEATIDLLNPEWQDAKAPPSLGKPVKVLAQLKKNRPVPGIFHALQSSPKGMFPFCSNYYGESNCRPSSAQGAAAGGLELSLRAAGRGVAWPCGPPP